MDFKQIARRPVWSMRGLLTGSRSQSRQHQYRY